MIDEHEGCAARLNLYSAVGPRLNVYHLDPASGRLALHAGVDMPAKVQYAWRHPHLPVLFVATSSAGPRQSSLENHVSAWRMADDGSLSPIGGPKALPARPVHICVDPSGKYLLSAHNYEGGNLTVHKIRADGSVGDVVSQVTQQDFGTYPHQVMVMPSGDFALIVDRGNAAKEGAPEEPGALRTFRLAEGQLDAGQVVAPNGGYVFGPRHVAFHPSGRWMYVSDERFNQLHVFGLEGGYIVPEPLQSVSTLQDPTAARARQLAGPIHVHPSGRAVYVANRADGTHTDMGRPIFSGGENNIAVFEVDAGTGTVAPVQHAETQSFHVRTFSMDVAARVLVAGSIKSLDTESGVVPTSLTVFDMDGIRLSRPRRVSVEVPQGELQYWVGIAQTHPT